jgi:hypothetical protein
MSGKAMEATVRVAGKVRHLRLDNNALCIVEEKTGVNLLGGVHDVTLRVVRALVYGSLLSGARRNHQPVDFDIDDVGDWMEEEPTLAETVTDMIYGAMPEPKEVDPPQVQEGAAT